MRCYGCGSSEGTESTLCPNCRAARAKSGSPSIKLQVKEAYRLDGKFIFHFYKQIAIRGFIGLLLLALFSGIYNFLDTRTFPFLAPLEQKVLLKCLDHVTQTIELRSRGDRSTNSVTDKAYSDIHAFFQTHVSEQEADLMLAALNQGEGKACNDLWKICGKPEMNRACHELLTKISPK